MAKPVRFDGCNVTLVADGCGDLPVHSADGQTISCWELDGEELMEVLSTKRVWLRVWGDRQPPVEVSGSTPFEEDEESEEGT